MSLEWEWVPSKEECERVSTCGKYGIRLGILYHLGSSFRSRYMVRYVRESACPDSEGRKHRRELENMRNGILGWT
jgi:hypothetical protein